MTFEVVIQRLLVRIDQCCLFWTHLIVLGMICSRRFQFPYLTLWNIYVVMFNLGY